MHIKKDSQFSGPVGRQYYKLIDLNKEYYNPGLRVVMAGRRGPVATIEQDGFFYVEASRDTLVGLGEQGIACLSGKGYIDGLKFVFESIAPSITKQYILPENEPPVTLLPSIAGLLYNDVEAARSSGNISFFKPLCDSVSAYFEKSGKKVYAELNNANNMEDPKQRGPVLFNLYEHGVGNMNAIMPITSSVGASRLLLRKDGDGKAVFYFEPVFPIVRLSF